MFALRAVGALKTSGARSLADAAASECVLPRDIAELAAEPALSHLRQCSATMVETTLRSQHGMQPRSAASGPDGLAQTDSDVASGEGSGPARDRALLAKRRKAGMRALPGGEADMDGAVVPLAK